MSEPKRIGRPPGSTVPPELRKSVRAQLLMTPGQAEKLAKLGGLAWIRAQIDRARLRRTD